MTNIIIFKSKLNNYLTTHIMSHFITSKAGRWQQSNGFNDEDKK